jgi:hypothetical protein
MRLDNLLRNKVVIDGTLPVPSLRTQENFGFPDDYLKLLSRSDDSAYTERFARSFRCPPAHSSASKKISHNQDCRMGDVSKAPPSFLVKTKSCPPSRCIDEFVECLKRFLGENPSAVRGFSVLDSIAGLCRMQPEESRKQGERRTKLVRQDLYQTEGESATVPGGRLPQPARREGGFTSSTVLWSPRFPASFSTAGRVPEASSAIRTMCTRWIEPRSDQAKGSTVLHGASVRVSFRNGEQLHGFSRSWGDHGLMSATWTFGPSRSPQPISLTITQSQISRQTPL